MKSLCDRWRPNGGLQGDFGPKKKIRLYDAAWYRNRYPSRLLGVRPKPRTPWGAVGGSLDKFPPESFTPPRDCGGKLGKGGSRKKGGNENRKAATRPQRGLQRRKTQGISSCQDGHTRALNGRDHSQIFQPPTHPTKENRETGERRTEQEQVTGKGAKPEGRARPPLMSRPPPGLRINRTHTTRNNPARTA
jgi:hypothetical protein